MKGHALTCKLDLETMTSRLLVVRHGDREDYARPAWRDQALALGHNVRDPPLSALGECQARETAAHIAERVLPAWGGRVDAVLASPYLRVIQTAKPLAERLAVPLCVEEGLAETHHCPGAMPSARERFAYFPVVDPAYESLHPVQADGCLLGQQYESYPIGYMRRMLQVARTFDEKLEGKTVVCYTHAASVALVSGLLGEEMPADESFRFAPCGVFQLEKPAGGAWRLVSPGWDNTQHVSRNSATTQAWGFSGARLQVWNALLRERLLRPTL